MPIANFTSSDVPYDLTNIKSGGNILDFVRNVNNLTGQTFMMGMLIAGFVIMFVTMREHGNKDALVASSFITTILGILFFSLGFISTQMLILLIIAFGGMFLFLLYRKD